MPDVLTFDDGLGKSAREPPPPFADWNDGMNIMKFDTTHVELLVQKIEMAHTENERLKWIISDLEGRFTEVKRRCTELNKKCMELNNKVMDFDDKNMNLELEVRRLQMVNERQEVVHEVCVKSSKIISDQMQGMLDVCAQRAQYLKRRYEEVSTFITNEDDGYDVPPLTPTTGGNKSHLNTQPLPP